MEQLSKLEQLLVDGIASRERQLDKYEEMIVKSELRMTNANEMVNKMVQTIGRVTDEYTKHIDNLTYNRDEILRQNTALIQQINDFKKEILYLHHQYDELLRQFIIVCRGGNVNENNINLDR